MVDTEERRPTESSSNDRPVPPNAKGRLLAGLAASIEERGYSDTTVAHVVRHARMSRRAFYQVFQTKDDALFALAETIDAELVDDLRAGVDSAAPWEMQVVQSIDVYFANILRHPAFYLCMIRELAHLGVQAASVVRRGTETLVELIGQMTDNEEFRRAAHPPTERRLALMIVGALNELVADMLETHGEVESYRHLAISGTTALLSTSHFGDQP
ncbi:AcrR family transcriptional regulator [Nocardioides zeae]|uniref:AcrR family transcriptional regulator n=1 Tax=Nocardioides zeae TaxID=1457234 RepID=A0ACC6IE70_9ACTN|nr:TetR/AcrR family transcriptional regulator [Nocardioides zeae]MDR6174205.1 AcrR family transcriptional regulator [Nocardioides zeae]MDR6209012.1 AcrR family transcriptional regulator [Nocardioides zeae]